ncbi:MAG: hypothetical protein RSD79_06395 [Cetobacterium sp.]
MKNIDRSKLPEEIRVELEKIENGKVDGVLKSVATEIESGDFDKALKMIKKEIVDAVVLNSPKNERNIKKTAEELLGADIEEEKEDDLTIELKKPIGEVDVITLNPDNINGTVLSKIEQTWRSRNKVNREMVKELDGQYLAMVAAVMSGIEYSTIMNLGGYDFTQLTSKVRNFLLVG